MKLLLHTCCAPCSVYCIKSLRGEGIEPVVYWFNPNIHPYIEYKTRRDTLKEYTKSIGINAIFDENYGLREFCKNVVDDLENRCVKYCYRVRLEQTAKYAKENGYDTFSTTLLISPYQNHEALKKIGEEMAEKYGLTFLYRDFRPGFKEGQTEARELGLYMQKYCGCVFSEENRNFDHIKKDKVESMKSNRIIEKRIRLGRSVKNLELKPYKNGKQDEIKFIYNLKKEVYHKYIEEIYGEWNEENQNKLFNKFMKENSKNIELIYLNDKLVGFYNGKNKDDNTFEIANICVMPEYQNNGIGTAVLKEILFENNDKDIILQCFKENLAIKLFERVGFGKTMETETHYIMKKSGNNKFQNFGTVTLATRTLVKACCGSDLVDCFENVNAEYLMSEGQIRTGEECHIKEMQLKKFN